MPPEAPRPPSMPRQGAAWWAQRLPLPHPGEPPSWPTSWRPHDYSRARQSCPGAPRPTHSSLPAQAPGVPPCVRLASGLLA